MTPDPSLPPPPSEAVLREREEPRAGTAPAPFWLIPLAGALFFWGALYLFLFSGGFRGDVFDEEAGLYGPGAGGKEDAGLAAAEARDPVALGRRIYNVNCAICHQPDGRGLPGQYPPLAGSEIVLGAEGYGENHLAHIVLDGLVTPVTVHGTIFNGIMVPWKEVLDDSQIAAVLTYVRQAWGNAAPPVVPQAVAASRAASAGHGPWTIGALRQLPAEAPAADSSVPAKALP